VIAGVARDASLAILAAAPAAADAQIGAIARRERCLVPGDFYRVAPWMVAA
jgi:hypothetical protein